MEYKCGCKTFIDTDRASLGYQIEYCPKHKSAPDLYEALKSLTDGYTNALEACKKQGFNFKEEPDWETARQAIAKAEGKSV